MVVVFMFIVVVVVVLIVVWTIWVPFFSSRTEAEGDVC